MKNIHTADGLRELISAEEKKAGRKPERRVTWQHEDTGNTFTKLIPVGEPIPEFPRRFVVKIEDV